MRRLLTLALQEIDQLSWTGTYCLAGVGQPFNIPGPDRGLPFHCAPLLLTSPSGQQSKSIARVGFSVSTILKLRFTGPLGSQGLLRNFVAALNALS